jgi:hypothetical protein
MGKYHIDIYNVDVHFCNSYKELREVCKETKCPWVKEMPKNGKRLHGYCVSFVGKQSEKIIVIWAVDIVSLCHEIVHAKNVIFDWISHPVNPVYDEPEAWLSHHLMGLGLAWYGLDLPRRLGVD